MELVNNIITVIVNPLVTLLVAVAVLYFLWGMLKFISNADNPEKRTEGATHMLWGIVGIAIMLSVFTFIHFIRNSVGPNEYNEIPSIR